MPPEWSIRFDVIAGIMRLKSIGFSEWIQDDEFFSRLMKEVSQNGGCSKGGESR
jgi:hypothetical protein